MSARVSSIAFLLLSAGLGAYYGAPFVRARGDARHLPGTTSDGHHQIEAACDGCHTPWRGVSNDRCNACHGGALAEAADAHGEAKFADPRNADRIAGLDARACVTCHREHAPSRTSAIGVTLPADFCARCHEDVAQERPSHRGFAFESCASTGCHRFHDNRALYEDFLAKHLHEPDTRAEAAVVPREPGLEAPLEAADQDAPRGAGDRADIVTQWAGSAHARTGINCTGCHEGTASAWEERPGRGACARCHARQDEGFGSGKHGMREQAGLGAMTPGMARRPMKTDARARELGCGACHASHDYDTQTAAVDACLSCHDDEHSLAYRASRHFVLWQREQAGEASPGTGVSCATCHLPREVRRERGAPVVTVQHNQNANLRPNDKMVRSVCLACHGLGFALDALADANLVRRNFNGHPSKHLASLEMVERRLAEKETRKGERR